MAGMGADDHLRGEICAGAEQFMVSENFVRLPDEHLLHLRIEEDNVAAIEASASSEFTKVWSIHSKRVAN